MKNNFKALIDDKEILLADDRDVLTSALEQEIAIPYSCRVGGCGACKCILISGKVKELTESAYLLSEKEVKEGYILACQCHPETDLVIQVGKKIKKTNIKSENEVKESASIFDYLKFFLFHAIGLFTIVSLLAGRQYTSYGLLVVVIFYMVGDEVLGSDNSEPAYTKNEKILTYQLWLALPLLICLWFVAVWSVGSNDTLGFGKLMSSLTGHDLLQARASTAWYHHLSGLVLAGLMVGMVGTITGHELTHRTWDKVSMIIGRWLLAFSFDTSFSIEHVYGHHRYVSTSYDPATAPRGRNVYFHIVASTFKGNISAWKIEKDRLQKRRIPFFSFKNVFIRGQLMSLILIMLAFLISGYIGIIFFLGFGIFGKALLEIVNYMEHYGMVRIPNEPVQPRHSWNTNKRISSWSMFNLTRHSHHHAQGEVPYHLLRSIPEAPQMISGYLTTIVITLIPPLWHFLMKRKLKEWDEKYATSEELDLLKSQK